MEEDHAGSEQAWVVELTELVLDNDSFKMIHYGTDEVRGFDLDHLALGNISSRIKDIHYGPDSTMAFVERLSLKDDKGFAVRDMSTDFSLSRHTATMNDLRIQTNHSYIQRHVHIHYHDLALLGENIGELGVKAIIENSYVGAQDILYFAPQLARQEPFAGNRNMRINIAGVVVGEVSDLRINNVRATALQSMAVSLDGTVKGLPDIDKTHFNINLQRLTFAESDLYTLLPDTVLPSNIDLPSRTIARGSFRG